LCGAGLNTEWGSEMAVKKIAAVELGVLGEYAEKLPPIIARKKVGRFTGGWVTAKTLANDDYRGLGPRKRLSSASLGVAYPTPFLLEYLERKGIEEITVSDELVNLVRN